MYQVHFIFASWNKQIIKTKFGTHVYQIAIENSMKDLTISNIERQNVLNNRFAVSKVQEHLDIEGMLFEGEYRFTKKMVADFYEVEERTIERYLEKYSDELSANGYVLCKGKHLKEFKLQFAPVINVGSKTTQHASIAL